ncbi:MAG: signal peptidase II [Desertimonas sp.]
MRAPLAIAAVVLLLDQLTKHWAVNALADGHVIDVVGSLRFNLAFNRGMAFSRGTGLGPVIGIVALIVVVVLLVSIGRATSRWYPLAVGLIIGGALGNITDRLLRGEGWLRGGVVDFIDVQWWPIFNVADVGVTVGGALLLLTSLREPSREASAPSGDVATGDVATGDGVTDGGVTSTVADDHE